MTTLIQIGNSKGVRIPKALIEKAKLANVEIALEVVPQGLLLHPIVVKHAKIGKLNFKKLKRSINLNR